MTVFLNYILFYYYYCDIFLTGFNDINHGLSEIYENLYFVEQNYMYFSEPDPGFTTIP